MITSDNIICWHGTPNIKNAKSILKTGFNLYTYFALHLEDALCYGGKHVFEVDFDKNKMNPNQEDEDKWQFINAIHISPEQIITYKIYDIDVKYRRED